MTAPFTLKNEMVLAFIEKLDAAFERLDADPPMPLYMNTTPAGRVLWLMRNDQECRGLR